MCFPVGGKTKKVIDARQSGDTKTPEILQTTTVRLIERQRREEKRREERRGEEKRREEKRREEKRREERT